MATEVIRGFASELQANPWYRWIYLAQIAAWLVAVAFYEAILAPAAPLMKHIIDGGTTMSFLAYGSLASSVLIVDAAKTAYERGTELMGILLTPAKNKFVAQGEAIGEERGKAIGEAIGEERGKAIGADNALEESSDWFARYRQAQEDGREFTEPPPWERNGKA